LISVLAGIVADSTEYPWSSYRFNTLGQTNDLIIPHVEFHRLGSDDNASQAAYRALLNQSISKAQIKEIRDATNKAGYWATAVSRNGFNCNWRDG
jgi:putative transposase